MTRCGTLARWRSRRWGREGVCGEGKGRESAKGAGMKNPRLLWEDEWQERPFEFLCRIEHDPPGATWQLGHALWWRKGRWPLLVIAFGRIRFLVGWN
jgi:hypothetical protein